MLYENQTFKLILNRMLDKIPNTFDKREGSIIYDALAPAASELAMAYIQLDTVLNESFADTASRKYLIKRAEERGLKPFPATNAVLKGEFKDSNNNYIDIPINSRFSLDLLNYTVIERIDKGIYQVMCEEPGSIGNQRFGTIVPIEFIQGLATAELTELLIPGEDVESTESLRKRYFDSLDSQAFGGNVADYKEKVNGIEGVGGVKVYPVWNGGGTIKLVIIDGEYNKPSSTLIDQAQTIIDPTQNDGEGLGVAPIGHVVTVEGVVETTTTIDTSITFEQGYSWEDVELAVENKINDYYKELSKTWAGNNNLVVRISQIETRILDVIGILDIQNTTINEAAQNLVLGENEIPVLGGVTT